MIILFTHCMKYFISGQHWGPEGTLLIIDRHLHFLASGKFSLNFHKHFSIALFLKLMLFVLVIWNCLWRIKRISWKISFHDKDRLEKEKWNLLESPSD